MNQWFSPDVAITVQSKQPPSFRTEEKARSVSPVLGLCRLMIAGAFKDAIECKDGEPTPVAIEAVQWIEAHTDWTLQPGCPIPPEEIRRELYGSFDWCCRWLNEDPDRVRQEGLPPPICRLNPPRKNAPMKSRAVRPGGHQSPFVKGLPDIHARWEAARVEHAARETEAQHQTRTKPGVMSLPAVAESVSSPGVRQVYQ